MPINNTKGLEALRALSEGGSAGLSAYKAAQGGEAASRTSALQGALGGMDVADAAAKAQAKYAPKVAGGGLSVGDLGAAANNYLSNAASKIAAQNDRDQANLTLQAESLRRQQVSDKDRALMMQGAADEQAIAQQGNVAADAGLGGQLANLGQRKANLREDLTKFDQANGANGATAHLAALGAAGNPELIAQMQAAQAQREQQRGDILRQMAGLDEQYNAAAGQYAGFLGTDTKGLMDQYAAADRGDTEAVRALLGSTNMQGMAKNALGQRQRDIEMNGQERLRQQAEAFGIDPLVAKGMFREGEGDDLAIAGKKAKQNEYVAGEQPSLGIDEEDYKRFSKVPGVGDADIQATVGTDNWNELDALTAQYTAQGGFDKQTEGGATRVTGLDGYREILHDAVEGATHADGQPLSDKEKQTLINLMMAKNKTAVNDAFGKGEDSE